MKALTTTDFLKKKRYFIHFLLANQIRDVIGVNSLFSTLLKGFKIDDTFAAELGTLTIVH